MKIGLLDSGIGGIAVLKQLNEQSFNCKYLYFADNQNAPYGSLNKQQLRQRLLEVCSFLVENGAEIILLLCNTATVAAKDFLEKIIPVSILGVSPDLSFANDKSLVLSTMLTAERLIANGAASRTEIVGLRSLSAEIESAAPNFTTLMPYLKQLLEPYSDRKTVHLACTHYIHIAPMIRTLMPNATLLDGIPELIEQLKMLVPIGHGASDVEFVFSGENKESLYRSILNGAESVTKMII